MDALELYLRLKGRDRDEVFHRTAKRNIKYVIKAIGNKNIKDISSSDGAKFRDWLLNKGLSTFLYKDFFRHLELYRIRYGIIIARERTGI